MDNENVLNIVLPNQLPTSSPTLRDYMENAENEPVVVLHRQIGGPPLKCNVIGCINMTSNECGFCLYCHPMQKVDDFPCHIR
jgi:hypothetical protein